MCNGLESSTLYVNGEYQSNASHLGRLARGGGSLPGAQGACTAIHPSQQCILRFEHMNQTFLGERVINSSAWASSEHKRMPTTAGVMILALFECRTSSDASPIVKGNKVSDVA